MTDAIVTAILIAIVIGQVIAALRSVPAGVAFFLSVAPLNYFSVWAGVTWDPERLCAAAALIIFVAKHGRVPRPNCFAFGFLALYGLCVTALSAPSWPTHALDINVSFYGGQRWIVQITTWLINFGMALYVGKALESESGVRLVRRVVLASGTLLCIYGLYQGLAFNNGMPVTGIRRHFSKNANGVTQEEKAFATTSSGLDIYRPNSFSGEPKSLGAACVVWLCCIYSILLTRRATAVETTQLIIILIALGLTLATSAWISALLVTFLFIFVNRRYFRTVGLILAMSLGVLVIFVAISQITGLLNLSSALERTNDIAMLRSIDRLEDNALDTPEALALQVLRDRPYLSIFGTGLGGMSFYIADVSPVMQDIILFPNSGFIGFICNVGIVGLLAYIALCLSPWLRVASYRVRRPDEQRVLSLIAGSAAMVTLIFGNSWIQCLAMGAALAANASRQRGKKAVCCPRADRTLAMQPSSYQLPTCAQPARP